jgi:putative ABC transport system permease protein
MLKNNLKIALRQLSKNRFFTFLNVAGLSAGLAVVLLIGLFVRDEMSFDQHHENADRIFRINMDFKMNGKESKMTTASAPMAATFLAEYPAVEAACRFRQYGFITIKKGTEAIEEARSIYADASFFDVFTAPLLEGDPKTALVEPNTGVISEKIALKYFGATTGIVGRSLRINDLRDLRVTGVLREMPEQSHFHFDLLFSMAGLDESKSDLWLSNNFQTYLLLRKGASAAPFSSHFEDLKQKYLAPQFAAATGGTLADFEKKGDFLNFSLQNIREIHLKSDRQNEFEANSDLKYVWIFGSVALIVLLLACVNFMNLSTARSAGRAREVGVRKALGSNRSALIRQFLMESLVLTVGSFALALAIVWLVLPAFNAFSGKKIVFSLLDGRVLGSLAGLAFLTATVAGSYPAFFLSKFRPIETLKGTADFSKKTGGSRLRSGLVVFQFCVSLALISSVLIVQKQLAFIQNKKIGWEKELLVTMRNTWWLREKTLDFKSQLLQIQGIESVSAADYLPTPSPRSNTIFTPEGKNTATESISSQFWEVDFDYQKTLGLTMKSGRWFDQNLKTDSMVCVINEAAAKTFGWPNDAVGRNISTPIGNDFKGQIDLKIIGVVEDFNFESLREHIGPVIFNIGKSSGTMTMRLSKTADIEKTMAAVGLLYKAALPAQTFDFHFLDDQFNQQYRTERRIGKILGAFAGFAIFIACLGLFGLAAFMAERRTKEIGIRKVLGASVGSVVGLLSFDFLKLVFIALVLAAPVAYFLMKKWLADFAFRIEIGWEIFALAGIAAVGIAFLTVSFQAIKAALADPVKSLRSE